MNDMSRSKMKELERVQAQATRAWLVLPCETCNVRTVSDARVIFHSVLRALSVQEAVRDHLPHISRLQNNHLGDVIETRPFTGYSKVLAMLGKRSSKQL